MTSLPSLESALQSKDSLDRLLSTLFEHSPILSDTLVPQLLERIAAADPKPQSHVEIIDLAADQLRAWPPLSQAAFIDSHPRIGEVTGLSALSAKEQATKATPPTVLARLAHLNALYEQRYTGLKYVVFVNGRSRAEIVPLIEETLGIGPAEEGHEAEPALESVVPLEVEDAEWQKELKRAIEDVVHIAKARLKALGEQ
ncbi:hypothetical protein FRC01_013347 [Tulasnella sp. 417]|nr:hypothetical protein FRC01_013347 [Tulasnella sp. 417]